MVAMDSKESMTMLQMENPIPNPNPIHHRMDIPPTHDHVSTSFSSLPMGTGTTLWSDPMHHDDYDDQKSSLGFMELLGFQDFTTTAATANYSFPSSSSLIFDYMMTYDQLVPPSSSLSMEIPTSASSVAVAVTATAHPLKRDDNADLDHRQHRVNHAGKEEEEDITVDDDGQVGEESSVVLNGQPSSPNSSSISSPAATTVDQQLHDPLKQCMKGKKTTGGDQTKTKKKKEREPRFAFMTRTEIDHLDDGYRWRKYGQKAVKNSPYPRSYYRCTSASCNVKKRVERCMSDPSFVVTTYEGQHIHPSPSAGLPSTATTYSFNHQITHNHLNSRNLDNMIINPSSSPTTYASCSTPPAMLKLDRGGLLQDMLPNSRKT